LSSGSVATLNYDLAKNRATTFSATSAR
jgi:hypothetical protein